MKSIQILILAFIVGSCSAVRFNRTCPTNVPVVSYFQPNLFSGTWFVEEGYTNAYDDFHCMTATMTEHLDGYRIFVKAYNVETETYLRESTLSHLVNPEEYPLRGAFRLDFNNAEGEPIEFQVVATDYSNFAIVWGCENARDQESSFEQFMLFTRVPNFEMSPAIWARIEDLVDRFVDRSQIKVIYQDRFTCLGWIDPYNKA